MTARIYCEQVEQCYEAVGYIRCKADEKRNLDQHLAWAVRFQVLGKSLDDMADAEYVESSTVLRGVYELLRLINLKKHGDAKQGRRKGSKNKRLKFISKLGH